MEGKRYIQTIRLDSILSYGPGTPEFSLEPLNVLIGPNASGKSNLIAALSLLAAAPRDLQRPFLEGGGVSDWIWKGSSPAPTSTLDLTVGSWLGASDLTYHLSFSGLVSAVMVASEEINSLKQDGGRPSLYQHRLGSKPQVYVRNGPNDGFVRELGNDEVKFNRSILAELRDFFAYPELTSLAGLFEQMCFYREFPVGPHAPSRRPQQADLQHDRLLEDASNLGVVLSNLQNQPPVRRRILERMKGFYPGMEDLVTTVSGGTVQIFFHEKGLDHAVPAARLSDGSLRYLCLLAVLCRPNPPPIICIEEPEIGLHPDMLTEVAKLLVEASSRSQIFVTTHSDILVDALTDVPESVVVCEKIDGATQLRRLSAEELAPWIENYRLGELWTRGHIGGNRW